MRTLTGNNPYMPDSAQISHICYYARLASVRFNHAVCCGSLMTTYIILLAYLAEHSLVHWYQQCVTIHHVAKCLSGLELRKNIAS